MTHHSFVIVEFIILMLARSLELSLASKFIGYWCQEDDVGRLENLENEGCEHTHTHIYIYIYIYILFLLFFFL